MYQQNLKNIILRQRFKRLYSNALKPKAQFIYEKIVGVYSIEVEKQNQNIFYAFKMFFCGVEGIGQK